MSGDPIPAPLEDLAADMVTANDRLYDLGQELVGDGGDLRAFAFGIGHALGFMAGTADHDGNLRGMILAQFNRAYFAAQAQRRGQAQ